MGRRNTRGRGYDQRREEAHRKLKQHGSQSQGAQLWGGSGGTGMVTVCWT